MVSRRNALAIALILVLVLALLWWAWAYCHLGRFSKKGCPGAKGTFCGGPSDPGAAAEAAGLRELGWRPEKYKPFREPSCPGEGPSPDSIAEAQALQRAGALPPWAPFYTELGPVWAPAPISEQGDTFASRAIHREQSSFAKLKGQQEGLRSAAPHASSRHQARMDSMREGFGAGASSVSHFGGPAQAGYGWFSSDNNPPTPPAAAGCVQQCADACQGTHCQDYCADRCGQAGS